MVARFEGSYGRANLFDDTDSLMAEYAAGLACCHVSLENMQIRAADGREGNADDGLADTRVRAALLALIPAARLDASPSASR